MQDLPPEAVTAGRTTHRSITIDGAELEFTDGFADLHTHVYREILEGRGFTIEDARPSIDLAYRVRHSPVRPADGDRLHPCLSPSTEFLTP
jgi:UDP-N-acetyl-2-amino-2-deoxyglucuronate dehydrogenase